MRTKWIGFISVLVLSLAATSQALVVGAFEGGLDGWKPAGDATLRLATIGATAGSGAVLIEGPGGWQMLAKLDVKAIRSVLGAEGAAISADVTAFAEDMQTDWMNMEMIINGQNHSDNGANNNIGWKSLGGVDIVRDGTTQTLRWEVPSDLCAKIAGTDDNIQWFEIFIVTNNGAANTKIYIDNIQLLGAGPEPLKSKKILYVDATEGEAGNTTLAAGATFTSTADGSGADNLWRGRAFGNAATVFESGGQYGDTANPEDCPRLITSVEVPENDYEVYVYFWADTSMWRIQASLTDSAEALPLFLANDPNSAATAAVADSFAEPVPLLTEGNRTLWQAYLGTTGFTKMINVFVDDDPNHRSHNARTWYDGIGYKALYEFESESKPEPQPEPGPEPQPEPEPEPALEPVDPGTAGLVAYYPFENDTNDRSGNGLHGTIVGDPVFVAGPAGYGMALDFSRDYVDCGNSLLFNVTEQLTVAAWVNIRSVPGEWRALIAKGDNAWRLSTNSSTRGMHFGFEDGSRGWQAANSKTVLPLNEWHHVCGTYDLTNGGRIYIDGQLDGTNSDTKGITLDTYNVYIGENSQQAGRFWDGLIDEVVIYNRALSAGEVAYLARK